MSAILTGSILPFFFLSLFLFSCEKDKVDKDDENIVQDADGNNYKTVTIGDQVWMAENLKTTRFSDDTQIPEISNDVTWSRLTDSAFCWYQNDEQAYGPQSMARYAGKYGALYNWHAVNTGKLCPTGWHVPNEADWTELEDFLGGKAVAGGKLKENGTTNWLSPNKGATDEYEFSALPTGFRSGNFGDFRDSIGAYAAWWSRDTFVLDKSWIRFTYYNSTELTRDWFTQKSGLSVRCIKD